MAADTVAQQTAQDNLSDTPARINSVAPTVGTHTEEVLLELGYTWENMAELKEQGVIP